jgi:hypothetical protein
LNRQEILERERRWAKPAAVAAILAAPLYIASLVMLQSSPVPVTGLATEQYRSIDANAGLFVGSAVLSGIALGLLCIPLLYLFRAAQARNERVSAPMVGFVFIGPLLLAARFVVLAVAQTSVASDFVAQADPGGDIYTLLDDMVDDSTTFDVAANLLFPAILGLLVAMIYVPLQAMRAGLVTRFLGTLGMALGAALLFIIPQIALLTLVLWFGWLGLLFLDRVPRGRPPAWAAGEAIPWPKPGEEPGERSGAGAAGAREPADAAVVEGEGVELLEDGDAGKDRSARRERARKRKRKQRRR